MSGRRAVRDERHVALLRGVNVGGKNKLPMSSLAELFAAAGCRDVRTYIQSGNVVFSAGARVLASLERVLPGLVGERFGFEPPLVLRSAAELARVAAANPFLASDVDPRSLHVAFLQRPPAKGLAAALDPNRSPGDAFVLRGRELFLHLPNGAGRTKLTNAYLDSKLGTLSTLRNWRTVQELVALARG